MILNRKIIRNSPNVGLGEAFRVWLSKAPNPETRKIWHKYFAEIIDRDYDQLAPLMTKVFRMMEMHSIGVDYELFYQAMEVWDDGTKEIRANIAKTVYSGQGGYRPTAGAKSVSPDGPKQPLGISRVAPDVASIVASVDGSKTEFVENAIRFYDAHLNRDAARL